MRFRPPGILVLALVAASCTGGADANTRAGGGADRRAVDQAAGAAQRRAQMQSGTNWADGVLASFCSGGRCTTDEKARPRRVLPAADSGLLLFIVPERPIEGSVTINRIRGRIVLEQPVQPGTTMPVKASLRAGRYVVSLRARWDTHEARWLFGLRVPA